MFRSLGEQSDYIVIQMKTKMTNSIQSLKIHHESPSQDRLDAIFTRLNVSIRPSVLNDGNFLIYTNGNERCVEFILGESANVNLPEERVLYVGKTNFNSLKNPLLFALPDRIGGSIKNSNFNKFVELFLRESSCKGLASSVICNSLCRIILIKMLQANFKNDPLGASLILALSDPCISRVLYDFHKIPTKQWSVEKLCDASGLSKSVLYERFSKYFGMSPIAYQKRLKLLVARSHILSNVPLKTVAAEFGYKSPQSFSRAFKKEFG